MGSPLKVPSTCFPSLSLGLAPLLMERKLTKPSGKQERASTTTKDHLLVLPGTGATASLLEGFTQCTAPLSGHF